MIKILKQKENRMTDTTLLEHHPIIHYEYKNGIKSSCFRETHMI